MDSGSGNNSPPNGVMSPVFGHTEDHHQSTVHDAMEVQQTASTVHDATEFQQTPDTVEPHQQNKGRRPPTVPLGQMAGGYEDAEYEIKTQALAPVVLDGPILKVHYKRNKAVDLAQLSHLMGGQPHCQDYLVELVDGVSIEGDANQFPKIGPEGNYGSPMDVNNVMFPSLKQDPPIPRSVHTVSAVQSTLGFQMHEMLRKRNEGCNLVVNNWCYIFDQGKKWEGQIWKIERAEGVPTKYYLNFPMWNSTWKNHCFLRRDLELWVPPPKYELKRTHPLNRSFNSLKSVRQFERVETVCGKVGLVLFNDEFRYVMDLQFADGSVMPVCYLAVKVVNPQGVVARGGTERNRTPKRVRKGVVNAQQNQVGGPTKRRRQAQDSGGQLDVGGTPTPPEGHVSGTVGGLGANAPRQITFDEMGLRQIMRETMAEFRSITPSPTKPDDAPIDLTAYATKLQVTTAVRTAQEEFRKAGLNMAKLNRENLANAAELKKVSDEQRKMTQDNEGRDKDIKAAKQKTEGFDSRVSAAASKANTNSTTIENHEQRIAELEKRTNEMLTPQVISLLTELATGEVDTQVLEVLKAKVHKMELLSQETNPTVAPPEMDESPVSNSSQLDMFRQLSGASESGLGATAADNSAPPTSTPAVQLKSTITRPKTPHPSRPNDNRVESSKKRLMFNGDGLPDSLARKKDFNETDKNKPKLQKFVAIVSELGTSKQELEHRRIERRAELTKMFLCDDEDDSGNATAGEGVRTFVHATSSSATSDVSPKPIMKYDTFKPSEEKLLRKVFDKAVDDERCLSIENHMGMYVVTIPWKTKGSIAHCEHTDTVSVLPRRELLKIGALAQADDADTTCAFWRLLTEHYLNSCDRPIHWTTTPKRPSGNCPTMDQIVSSQPEPWGFLIKSSMVGLRMVSKDGKGDVAFAVEKIRKGVAAIQRYESNWVRDHNKSCKQYLSEK